MELMDPKIEKRKDEVEKYKEPFGEIVKKFDDMSSERTELKLEVTSKIKDIKDKVVEIIKESPSIAAIAQVLGEYREELMYASKYGKDNNEMINSVDKVSGNYLSNFTVYRYFDDGEYGLKASQRFNWHDEKFLKREQIITFHLAFGSEEWRNIDLFSAYFDGNGELKEIITKETGEDLMNKFFKHKTVIDGDVRKQIEEFKNKIDIASTDIEKQAEESIEDIYNSVKNNFEQMMELYFLARRKD